MKPCESIFWGSARLASWDLRQPEAVEAILVSPTFDLRVLDGKEWRIVKGEKVLDQPMRHSHHPSATTTARFQSIRTDRFRIVFTAPREQPEVVFELSAVASGFQAIPPD